MKGTVIAVFAVLLAVAAARGPPKTEIPVGECPEVDGQKPVYLMDKWYRNVFYECNNGQKVRMSCPTGLVFDPRTNVCNFPCTDCKPYGPVGTCTSHGYHYLRFLRDGTNVGTYYICARDLTPWDYYCDEGQYFNTISEACKPLPVN